MCTAVPYTDADLLAIRAARLRGVRTVQFADRAVTYSSDQELRQLEGDIARELAGARRGRQYVVVSGKGFTE